MIIQSATTNRVPSNTESLKVNRTFEELESQTPNQLG